MKSTWLLWDTAFCTLSLCFVQVTMSNRKSEIYPDHKSEIYLDNKSEITKDIMLYIHKKNYSYRPLFIKKNCTNLVVS